MIIQYANGQDHSQVAKQDYVAPVKSIGHGITTREDLENSAEVWNVMLSLMQDVGHKLRVYDKNAGGVAIDIRNNELAHKQWQTQLPAATHSTAILAKEAFSLFSRSYRWDFQLDLLQSVQSTSVHKAAPSRLTCSSTIQEIARKSALRNAVESIRERLGKYAIMPACLCQNIKMPTDREIELKMPTGMIG